MEWLFNKWVSKSVYLHSYTFNPHFEHSICFALQPLKLVPISTLNCVFFFYISSLSKQFFFKEQLQLLIANLRIVHLSLCLQQVPYVKVAPEDILKVQFPRFTTLDLRPTNTDISLAVAGLLTFFNSTTACLICAQPECEYGIRTFLQQNLTPL